MMRDSLSDLTNWEPLGLLFEDGYFTEPGEDCGCNNFLPIGNGKHLVLFFSHKRFVKGAKLMPGYDEVLMPGEMETRMRRQKEADGVPVDDETWGQICETGQSVGVSL